MNVLLILNDPPYGTERSYNGLRLAGSLAKRDGTDVKVFPHGRNICPRAWRGTRGGVRWPGCLLRRDRRWARGIATGNFYATPDPVVRLKTPGRRWHWAKVLLERTWFPRWL